MCTIKNVALFNGQKTYYSGISNHRINKKSAEKFEISNLFCLNTRIFLIFMFQDREGSIRKDFGSRFLPT